MSRLSAVRQLRRGFTIIEIITVLVVIGVILAAVVPRMHVTPEREVRSQAYQLVNDLELARTKAISSKSQTRMVFDVTSETYTGFIDDDHDGIIMESPAEQDSLRGFGTRTLPSTVQFGQGAAPVLPDVPIAGPIGFAAARLNFSNRGTTLPFQTRGVIYLVHRDDPNVVAAVAVSGAGSFKVWVYRNGSWQ
jgi:prepilin-type N-terminal cleavage/methylation domain-containing protein